MKKLNRVGERYRTNQGYWITITEYFGDGNCTIRFDDGTTIYNRRFGDIKKGQVAKPVNRVGETFINGQGCALIITEYINSNNVTVQFEDGVVGRNKRYSDIVRGEVRNPYYPSLYGKGYIGVGKYVSRINGKMTMQYSSWKNVLERCYDEEHLKKNQTYTECYPSKEWHCLQDFGKWFDENYSPEYMQGWELDKDIITKGNKLYSPETCDFVPKEINNLFLFCKKTRGKYPIGVRKTGKRFNAYFTINRVQIPLGTFDTIEEAFQAYKTAKEQHIKNIADKWRGKITERTYRAMYNWTIEITD